MSSLLPICDKSLLMFIQWRLNKSGDIYYVIYYRFYNIIAYHRFCNTDFLKIHRLTIIRSTRSRLKATAAKRTLFSLWTDNGHIEFSKQIAITCVKRDIKVRLEWEKGTLAYVSNNKLYFARPVRARWCRARDATNAKIEIIFILREKQKHPGAFSRSNNSAALSGRRVNRAAGISENAKYRS